MKVFDATIPEAYKRVGEMITFLSWFAGIPDSPKTQGAGASEAQFKI